MNRYAIFGSAFNPPTNSHADILRWAAAHYDKVLVVPSYHHPYQKVMLPYAQRLVMLKAFLADLAISNVDLWDIEPQICHNGPVYTYDVLERAALTVPHDSQLSFIVGQDNANTLHQFHRIDEILSRWSVTTAPIDSPIRSTALRAAIQSSEPYAHMTTSGVTEIIDAMRLYQAPEYERPICTIDAILLKMVDNTLCIGLVKRASDARVYPGTWALPGGFVHTDKDHTLTDTLYRNLKDKVGIEPAAHIKLDFEGNASRDPQGWSVTCPYLCLIGQHTDVQGTPVDWRPIEQLLQDNAKGGLPFDHAQLIASAYQRLRNLSQYSTLPNALLDAAFTLPELQRVYEAILGAGLHKKNFRDRLLESGAILDIGQKIVVGKTRASLYVNASGIRYFNRVICADAGKKESV